MNRPLLALSAPLLAAAAGFIVGFLSGGLTFLPVAGLFLFLFLFYCFFVVFSNSKKRKKRKLKRKQKI